MLAPTDTHCNEVEDMDDDTTFMMTRDRELIPKIRLNETREIELELTTA